jgi:hypothetical protein
MLDQIISLVKQFGQETVVNNPDVPNEHNNEVLAEAGKTVAGGLQNVLAGGGFENILSLFGGQGGNQQSSGIAGLMKNPIVSMMVGHLVSKLVGKFNMNPQQASNVSASLIPNVLNQLIQKTQDPNNSSFTLDGLVQSLTGGNVTVPVQAGGGGGLQDLLKQFTGGGNAGGGMDIGNIISQITNQSQNQMQNQKGGGGLMDLIKGFM